MEVISLSKIISSLDAGVSVNGEQRPKETGELGVLKVSAVSSGTFNPTAHKAVIPHDLSRVKESPKKGHIIVSRSNTPELVGACGYCYEDHPNLYLSDKLWQIKLNKDAHIDPEWLYHSISTPRALSYISQLATGSSKSMQNISKENFLSLDVLTPPYDSQLNISKVARLFETEITTLQLLISEKEKLHSGLKQQLLSGKRRLPKFSKPWITLCFSDFFDEFLILNNDRTITVPLTCSKIHGIILQSQKFDKRVASKDLGRYKIVRMGDLIYDPMLLWDKSIGFLTAVDSGVVSPAYSTFHFDGSVAPREYFEFRFDTAYMRYQFQKISQGTNTRRRKAPAKDFLSIQFSLPSDPMEINTITSILSTSKT